MKKVAFYTLGCKVNQYETEALKGAFLEKGYEIVDFSDYADIYVINTCTVTHLSDRKSRQMIRKAVQKNPRAVVAAVGCYAQVAPEEILKIPEVNLVLGTVHKNRLVELVEKVLRERTKINAVASFEELLEFEEMPLKLAPGKARAFVKIQEGCNSYCAYCIIPYARGPLRSRPLEDVVAEVKKLCQSGFSEIVLTGIHTGAYGQEKQDLPKLADLVAELFKIPELKRLRLSSIEPQDFTVELLDVLANSPKFCRHLHLPLQSGDDDILKAMRRKYTSYEYLRLIETIRERIPDIALTSDVIVGFPGETEEQFLNSYNLVKKVGFMDIHVFKYSPRAGTPAAKMPGQIPEREKERRSLLLLNLKEELFKNYASKFLGKILEVIPEEQDTEGFWEGHSDNYLRVKFSGNNIKRGEIYPVKIIEIKEGYVSGELVNS
ncbi:tRNA (N(6)-L-threonylcarbamoyladenosine(37)-C(2))-methylthiotransferase MtaB [Carboxydothermus ferrireducens]|uniref:tRNA (N(6)-L-threonylcarbamoyladenosine(37)-C(2))-methylthiotransferase n=1 Tax=Carboxydothermus ferrireducens DSM 11255 TaxID=1119529 RepID=A0ABX2R578_9THEO|nr:tRNA (N(6)-L-threonylcarbamoyladenosine(37)-C(2))-methylthiotransferase MtaB [Carboxydothermus ferrireducens]NYE56312.1 threonylcarbamoyladenosine tRNA methylthiotransferase MtaB [Carboxydothermus ferrireducens DSM 11255]